MNRRHFLTAVAPSIGLLLATNRQALARMQDLATPDSTPDSRPEIELEEYTPQEAVYIGALATWLEMLEDTLELLSVALDVIVDSPESPEAQAQMFKPLGVWDALATDAERFEGPELFAITQEYAVGALTHLRQASGIISKGLLAGSPTAISLGTEHIYLATDEIEKLVDSLPFERPRRSDIFG